MKRNKLGSERTDVRAPRNALSDRPMAQLAESMTKDLPDFVETPGPDLPATPIAPKAEPPGPRFHIERTRKGGYPVSLEKRPMGKTVTVVRKVTGDVEGLLRLLKKRCGAGGSVQGDQLELQGDHCVKVVAFLRESSR